MSECDHESSIMRRPWPTGGGGAVAPWFKTNKSSHVVDGS